MRLISLISRPVLLGLAVATLIFAGQPVSADLDVSSAAFITPDEFQQIVQTVLNNGKDAEVGEAGIARYLEFRQGGLRQYVTVEGTPEPGAAFAIKRVGLTQESWSKTEANQDVIDQWIFSIQQEGVFTTHRQLVEADSQLRDNTPLPAGHDQARSVARSIIRRFLER